MSNPWNVLVPNLGKIRITVFSDEEIDELSHSKVVEMKDGYDGCTRLFMSTSRYAAFVESNEYNGANTIAELTHDDRDWHPCYYENGKLHHEGSWRPGRWYEWLDRNYNVEIARMKDDAWDHFFPDTKIIKEEDVIAFRDTAYLYLKEKSQCD